VVDGGGPRRFFGEIAAPVRVSPSLLLRPAVEVGRGGGPGDAVELVGGCAATRRGGRAEVSGMAPALPWVVGWLGRAVPCRPCLPVVEACHGAWTAARRRR
jgi:hypothetical protein